MSKPPRPCLIRNRPVLRHASRCGQPSLFQTERIARLFIDTLDRYRREGRFLFYEFVVMPNHFHLLLTPLDIPLEKALQFIKGGFSYRIKKELGLNLEIWERGYVEHRIRDARGYQHHIEYIRQNPVKAGLVTETEQYLFSSAHSGFDLDPRPQGLGPDYLEIA